MDVKNMERDGVEQRRGREGEKESIDFNGSKVFSIWEKLLSAVIFTRLR